MGRRRAGCQPGLWAPTADLPRSPGHACCKKLNRLLAGAGFDCHVEGLRLPHYAEGKVRDSIPPGVCFRMLFVGHFEGLDSQPGVTWRCSHSLSLHAFLGTPLGEALPDHPA